MDAPCLPDAIFKTALNHIAMVAVTDLTGHIIFVNDKFCHETGYSREQLLGSTPQVLNSGIHDKKFFSNLWKTILAGDVWNGDICNKRPDGSLYWLETTIMPVLDEYGKPFQFMAIRKDISEINRQLGIYNTILDTVSHAIFTINLQGEITLFNKGAQHLLEYSPEEVLDSTTPLLFLDSNEVEQHSQTLSYELKKLVPQNFEVLTTKAALTGAPDEKDWTFISKSGKRLTVHLSVSPLVRASDQHIYGFVGIGLDVSAHRKIASQIPGVVFQYILRPNGSSFFPYVSAGVANVLRLRPQDLCTSSDQFFNQVHADDVANVGQALRDSAHELSQARLEFRIDFSHEIRWILFSGIPELLPDGSYIWHGFMTDITSQKNVEEQVRWSAFHDALTGLHNRLFAQNEINRLEYSRSYPIAVFNIDLDGLKIVNDSYGHQAGDQYIQSAARVLRSTFRTEDLVARMGGDEFLVLVPQTSELGMASILERLQEQLQTENLNKEQPLALSIGSIVAHKMGELETAIRESDRLMYEDKVRRKTN